MIKFCRTLCGANGDKWHSYGALLKKVKEKNMKYELKAFGWWNPFSMQILVI